MTVEVTLWPQVHDDFRALPSDTLRLEALRYIVRLRDQPYFGQPLRSDPVLGDLGDCRKIYLDETHDTDPRWRIVYRVLTDDEREPTAVEVLIVGEREDLSVYFEALRRLGRPVPRSSN